MQNNKIMCQNEAVLSYWIHRLADSGSPCPAVAGKVVVTHRLAFWFPGIGLEAGVAGMSGGMWALVRQIRPFSGLLSRDP